MSSHHVDSTGCLAEDHEMCYSQWSCNRHKVLKYILFPNLFNRIIKKKISCLGTAGVKQHTYIHNRNINIATNLKAHTVPLRHNRESIAWWPIQRINSVDYAGRTNLQRLCSVRFHDFPHVLDELTHIFPDLPPMKHEGMRNSSVALLGHMVCLCSGFLLILCLESQ